MKIVILVEGHTEHAVLREFLKRWLDDNLDRRIGIQVVKFEGAAALLDDVAQKSRMHLDEGDVVAVVSLLDLHGFPRYPDSVRGVRERYKWGRKHVEQLVARENPVAQSKFRHFFAVHELEAWLLSDPAIFPQGVQAELPKKPPEAVNFDEPPARLLNRVYHSVTGRNYKKRTHGPRLFKKLNPELVYKMCPHFKAMMDELLELANAG